MRHIFNKFVALMVTLCMVASFGFTTFADATLTETQILDLKAFNILEGDENGELNLDQTITRAEFSKIVVKLMKMESAVDSLNVGKVFKDTAAEHWAYGYIAVASSLGLVNGDNDGNFHPDDAITYSQAAKILVTVVGFGEEAIKAGGYPIGYTSIAMKIGITKGVTGDFEQELDRQTAMRLVFNCLDCDRLVPSKNGAELSSKTLRDILMGNDTQGLMEVSGVVTANYETWLSLPLPNIKEDEIEVDNVRYKVGSTNAAEYIGKRVEMYVIVDDIGYVNTIKEIKEAKSKNTVVELDFDKVNSFSKIEISYLRDGDTKSTKDEISPNAIFLYNGRPVDSFENIGDIDKNQASIKLIANDGDEIYNYVFVNEYESFIVDKVKADDKMIYFDEDKRYNNKKSITLDKNEDITSKILNSAGEVLTLEDIKTGDVVSIYGSKDGKLIKILVENKTISGTVKGVTVEDFEILVDEAVYKVETDVDYTKFINEDITAKLNALGKIAKIETAKTLGNYGVVVRYEKLDTIGGNLQVMVAIPSTITNDTEEVVDSSDPNKKEVPIIAAQNKELAFLKLASKVTIDGVSHTGADVETALNSKMTTLEPYYVMRYSTNSKDEISRMESLKVVSNYGERLYNSYEKTFGKPGGYAKGAFGLGDKTLGVCIPMDMATSSNDDYKAILDMNNDQRYYVAAYEMNEETNCPDVVLFRQEMDYKTSGNVTVKSKIGMVTKISRVMSQTDEETFRVTMATKNGEQSYEVSTNTNSDAVFGNLKIGSLIHYSLDSRDLIDGYKLIAKVDSKSGDYFTATTETETFCGKISDVEYNKVAPELNKWSNVITMVGDSVDSKIYYVQKNNAPPIFVYDEQKGSIKIGDDTDLLRVMKQGLVYSVSGVVKAVVVTI